MEVADKTALIVDDSATARIMLARVLTGMNLQTRQAKSGEHALQALVDEQPDLIFLDHMMPGLDGFQTLKALKSSRETRPIPVIMYTTQNSPSYAQEALSLGAAGVISKEVERVALKQLMEKALIEAEELTAASIVTQDSTDSPVEDPLDPPTLNPIPSSAREPESPETALRADAGKRADNNLALKEPAVAQSSLPQTSETSHNADDGSHVHQHLQEKVLRLQWVCVALLVVLVYTLFKLNVQAHEANTAKAQTKGLQEQIAEQENRIQEQADKIRGLEREQDESRRLMDELAEMLSLTQGPS